MFLLFFSLVFFFRWMFLSDQRWSPCCTWSEGKHSTRSKYIIRRVQRMSCCRIFLHQNVTFFRLLVRRQGIYTGVGVQVWSLPFSRKPPNFECKFSPRNRGAVPKGVQHVPPSLFRMPDIVYFMFNGVYLSRENDQSLRTSGCVLDVFDE